MNMKDVLKESCVIADLKGGTKEEVLAELASSLKRAGLIDDTNAAVNVILEREKLGSTGIGEGVAIPHGKMKGLSHILCAFGRSKGGIDFDAVDKKPVHIFFLLIAPEDAAGLHIQMLSRISRVLRDPSFRKRLIEEGDDKDLYTNIVEEDKKFGE
ncbi:MAG: PTS sugar transporter subunit IIA [Syntrophorhabdales bacterium]|jgi:PTS system nitrogen regulatory IIA component